MYGRYSKKRIAYAGSINSASELGYDNTSSGLTADDVQEALDELNTKNESLESTVSEIATKVDDTAFEQISDEEISAITD